VTDPKRKPPMAPRDATRVKAVGRARIPFESLDLPKRTIGPAPQDH
jgi:hypothetical protein